VYATSHASRSAIIGSKANKEGNHDFKEQTFNNTAINEDGYDEDDEASTKTRKLSLMWDEAQVVARRGRNTDLKRLASRSNHKDCCDTFQLPPGISKSDIMVTVDVDDEARSSRADEVNEGDIDFLSHHHHPPRNESTDTSSVNNTTPNKLRRRNFEETVRQDMLNDLRGIYTAKTENAKLVLCIVICILNDGTVDPTYLSCGRVGLAEIALNWRLFGADDLKLYHGGLTVQRKDFGFGPLELTEAEGQYLIVSKLAPRAANNIVRQIGDVNEDFLVEL
jgi:hypothetical protein